VHPEIGEIPVFIQHNQGSRPEVLRRCRLAGTPVPPAELREAGQRRQAGERRTGNL
jgi:hypothetical protein